ncbi:CdaR family protein [Hydrogenivirga sp. 128-5-R1-1]|uniref:CdaR family protein n=1 Tax=Hydrogenivirga sp. 128-5-R1-1 TaxID=392423 RepID=UPI00015F37A2|nr:CdaR family protein [Hydrogenivirga sp. 128-5-R1-1]EDP73607.1 YbbR-like protein [Hydrogenivirga sp. 128-5-R1-1]
MIDKLKDTFINNLHLKILSLFIAFLLWLNITESQKTIVEFISFIDIRNIPQNYEIKSIYPEKVIITIQGSRLKMKKLDTSKVQAYIDASNLKEGENTLPVKIEGKLHGFKIISIRPDKVIIYADKIH